MFLTRNRHNTTKMSDNLDQEIFEIVQLIDNINIKHSAKCQNGVKTILAIVTEEGDVVLHYTYGAFAPLLRHIPWFTDTCKTIEAICFDPSATWLLVVCLDSSLYIIPALSLVDKRQVIDCKWSTNDITHFPKAYQAPDGRPTCLVWWQTLDSNQNALVGYETGAISLISLTDGRFLGSCSISEPVKELYLCQDKEIKSASLLMNTSSGQQWRLILEHPGYVWPPDINNQVDDSTRSRLYSLKQMGVDKLASLRQRFTDARGPRRDSQTSDTASESSHSDSVHSGLEMLPHLCDTFVAPQFARNRCLFSAFYKPTSLLTVHSVDIDTAPLYVYKLPQKTSSVILTDLVIYSVNSESNMLLVLSTNLTECRLEGDAEFNNESLLAQFYIDSGPIRQVYKIVDDAVNELKKNSNASKKRVFDLPKSIHDETLVRPKIDTCYVLTDRSVYRINVRLTPVLKFCYYILDDRDMEKAERLATIFNLNISRLLSQCGDVMLGNGAFHSGMILYKQAKMHLLKRVLKLAIAADCKTILKFIHLCLNASKVDMSMATKIHIGNLAVMAYTELILRYGGSQRQANIKDFMNFLCCEEYYDHVLAVNVACQAGHWNIVTLLAKCRGLEPVVVTALGQILQTSRAPRPTQEDFLYAISEPCLTQSLLVQDQNAQEIFHFIRTHVDSFPVPILRRFVVQLDPSQPCALPVISRMFQAGKYSSSLDTTIESVDFDNSERIVVLTKDLIETFLFVVITLIKKTGQTGFDLELLKSIEPPMYESTETPMKKLPDSRPLSCGFEHAAVIRNNDLYTMGVATAGCLGLGPLLSPNSVPKMVNTFAELKIKVLSVSCGRKHTLALTDYGVFAWGSNAYGQLGLGSYLIETPYPQMIQTLASVKVVELSAGQYHSLALSCSGKVYSWGWGIHGQLGHNNCDNEFYPKLLDFGEPVKQVAAGHAHSLILTCEGKLYGFGSNLFFQLDGNQMEDNKCSDPVWVVLMPEMYMPIEMVASSYFHNIAVRADQEVFTWGASPQDLRISHSKNNQKQNGISVKPTDMWKTGRRIYMAHNDIPIEQVAVGYRHSVILHDGRILWGKSNDEELCQPKLSQHESILRQRFTHVSCGLDYTMALDQHGKLLAWGSSSMAQILLGRSMIDDKRRMDGKMIMFKNTKRIVKIPNSGQGTAENFPIEVPGLPSMAITFVSNDRLLMSKNHNSYSILKLENENLSLKTPNGSAHENIFYSPEFKLTQKTLHYVLETYSCFYETDNLIEKCLDLQNYQAAAKISFLEGHYGDSLGFQLTSFKDYLESSNVKFTKETCEVIVRSVQEELNEKNLIYTGSGKSSTKILSSSSSLDSIRQWGDDVEHQGGCESPCDFGDIQKSVTQYVQSLKEEVDGSPPVSSVSRLLEKSEDKIDNKKITTEVRFEDKKMKEAVDAASYIVEFYIEKIYTSENLILMQNVLMRCIEFWLANCLPVVVLENILLKNMDKYFYPLSILLFCKDFNDDEASPDDKPAKGFLKEFSTKFCLELCSMVLDNVNKS